MSADVYRLAAQRLLERSESFVRGLFPKGVKRGREVRVGSLAGERGSSLSIDLDTGQWQDFASGQRGGDLLALAASVWGCSQGEALQRLAPELGIEMHKTSHNREKDAGVVLPGEADPDELWWQSPDVSPVAVYDYYRADGRLWAQVYRFERTVNGKREKVIRPWDPERKAWSLPEGDRPLYRLPELLSDRCPRLIVVVEGEKAADAVNRAAQWSDELDAVDPSIEPRWIATTALGGAQGAALADWSPLRGRHVVIWPDNDDPGEEYAKAVVEQLKRVRAGTVRRLPMTRFMPHKGDAADLPLDGIAYRLRFALVGQLEHAVGINLPADTLRLETLAQRYGGAPGLKWLVDAVVPLGAVTLLAGQGGIGKGRLLTHLATAMVDADRDHGWLNHKIATHGRVLYLTAEDDEAEVLRRFASSCGGSLSAGVLEGVHILSLMRIGGLMPLVEAGRDGISLTQHFETLVRLAAEIEGLRLLVIDPLVRFIAGDVENNPHATQTLLGPLAALAASMDIAVIVTHHMAKARGNPKARPQDIDTAREAIRGSTALVDGCRSAIALWEEHDVHVHDWVRSTYRARGAIVSAGLVKSNAGLPRVLATLVRDVEQGRLLTLPPMPPVERERPAAAAPASTFPDKYRSHEAQMDLVAWAVRTFTALGIPVKQSRIGDLQPNMPEPLRALDKRAIRALAARAVSSGSLMLVSGILVGAGQEPPLVQTGDPVPVLTLEQYERDGR